MIMNEEGHYTGFWIDWYDDLLKNETGDIDLYTKLISQKDSPVLELACGTGRVMVQLLKNGISCDGLDLSGPMLEACQKKLDREKLQARLIKGDILEFKAESHYQTIFVSGGSFQLIPDFDQAMQALLNIYKNLRRGGRFICDLWIPWDEIIANEQNTWKVGRVARRKDGSKLVVSYFKQFKLNAQSQTGEFKYELFRDGSLAKAELIPMKLKWFGVDEFRLMLEKAGFASVKTDEKPVMSSHGVSTVYTAEKT